MSQSTPVAVNILDREYLVACTSDERASLIAAAAYLDGKMREVRGSSRTQGIDRIAVMAGLNIAHEFMQLQERDNSDNGTLAEHVLALRAKLDSALKASSVK